MAFDVSSPEYRLWRTVATASLRDDNGADMQLAHGASMISDPEKIRPIAFDRVAAENIPVLGATILSLGPDGSTSYRTAVFAPEDRKARDPQVVEYAEYIDQLGQAEMRKFGEHGRSSKATRILGSRVMLGVWYETIREGLGCTIGGVLMTTSRTESGASVNVLPFVPTNVLKDSQKMEASMSQAIGRGLSLLTSAERNRRKAIKEGRTTPIPDGMGAVLTRFAAAAANATPRGNGPLVVPVTVMTTI